MSTTTASGGGPLAALIRYYDRLREDSKSGIAEYGFSQEKVHFAIVLETDGSFVALEDVRETNEKGKPIFRPLIVPDGGGRSGTSVQPNFCWDNTGYALGRDNKGKPARSKELFEAFRDLHLSFRDELEGDKGFAAVCSFLEAWKPAQAEKLPNWEDAAGMNVVFKLRGKPGYVHQSAVVRKAWLKRATTSKADAVEEKDNEPPQRGFSLISGQVDELARLHPLIGGVAGANTMGAAIVSFNLDAFESYGKSQSYNAPVSVQEAFRYTTALNRLLSDDSHRERIGDATVVFWTDSPAAEETCLWFKSLLAGAPQATEDAQTVDQLRNFLQATRDGRLSDVSDPQAPFYILGLSPNASRLNVRFWLVATVQQFVDRLLRHDRELEIVGREGEPPLSIRRILWETAREPKDIPPQLAGEVARSIFGGWPYPQFLFNAIVRRIRADSELNPRRAAVIKAFLIRNSQLEVPVSLDPQHTDQAYQLGRLFAALEKTQEDSTDGKLNATIKDRYFSAAGATPASVFPLLLKLHRHHLAKLDPPGRRINREKLMTEIMSNIRHFPAFMSLEKQGLFYIAYYHQRQEFFTKKETTSQETNNE
ncbi:type I-C CRISPR-associated protein Cas8c/Csd1 [Anatilimnocola floriformis]|uniref:type I-C CRISPR-associated protein Cas8c/Csd1 n=1 Tax=Anatilimnocola floriformis TaxID=2948575 RepID=UPI0020C57601|nr:type I-C CRISPR-associated protein Cas8c/Csd1 [Anatilimnocola floriformis]